MYLSSFKDQELQNILRNSIILPDSIGIVLAIFFFTGRLIKRISGVDVVDRMLEIAENKRYKVYFLGAKRESVNAAVKNIKMKYPHLEIVGWHDGYFKSESSIIKDIKQKMPDMVFVGLGSPLQEKFIFRYLKKIGIPLAIGIGGSIDVISGKLKRAPYFMQILGLEWFFRFIQEPVRLTRIIKLPIFLIKVLFKRI